MRRQPYDITEPQPQLFVAESISHLTQVLKDFAATLAYRRGGIFALNEGKSGATVTTTEIDGRLEVSGVIDDFLAESDHGTGESGSGAIIWVKWRGPCQLGHRGRVLQGQGIGQHPEGFSTVLGRSVRFPHKQLSLLTEQDLRTLGIQLGEKFTMKLTTGVGVHGRLREIQRAEDGHLLVLKLQECTVRRGDRVF